MRVGAKVPLQDEGAPGTTGESGILGFGVAMSHSLGTFFAFLFFIPDNSSFTGLQGSRGSDEIQCL